MTDIQNRDENTRRPLPKRLQELVAQYPYTTSPDPTMDGLLTRPRFSTRRHDALFVRVEAVYADSVRIQSSRSPVGIFNDALKSEPKFGSGPHVYLWDQVKSAATSDAEDKPLPAILSDDSISLLSLVSTDPKEQVLLGISGATSTLISPLSPVRETLFPPTSNGNGIPIPVRKPTLSSTPPQSPKDWAEFSSAGFGETTIVQNFASTLLDKDVEVTEPIQRKPSKQRQIKNPVSSVESNYPSPNPKAAPEESESPKLVLVATEIVQLDEAFIDFWRDAVADPVSSDWPKFVIGELKHPLNPRSLSTPSEGGEKASSGSPISWIIIEEKFRKTTPPPTPMVSHEALPTSGGLKAAVVPPKRSSSPRPSFGEKKSSSLSATLKRFSIFGGSRDDVTEDVSSVASGSNKKDSFSGKKKRSGIVKSTKVGDVGEEPEPIPEVPRRVRESEKVIPVVGGVVGGVLLANAAGSDEGKVETVKGVSPKEEVKEEVVKTATAKDGELPVPEPVSVSANDSSEPQPTLTALPLVSNETGPEVLPPAPESVISHGGTPGPQLALDSSEAGLHPEPAGISEVGVVPIVPSNPVEPAEVEVPEPEPPVVEEPEDG